MKESIARLLTLYMLAVVVCVTDGHSQITSNVFRRVLMIRAGDRAGTAFSIDVDGRQYLVTAKHVVGKVGEKHVIGIRRGDKWEDVEVEILRCNEPIDIAVLIPPKQITVGFDLEPTMGGIVYGQDMYFAGFPYGLVFTSGQEINALYPIPFIKRATASATENKSGVVSLFLDGHNNPGFSGGPIVFRDLDQRKTVYKVAGVVSGFRPEYTPVLKPRKLKPNEDISRIEARRVIRLKDGTLAELEDTDEMVATNTGIVVGYSIQHAVELIKKHPTGPVVQAGKEPDPPTK